MNFLKEEGIFEEVQNQAIKEVVAWQLAQAMKEKKISKNRMATLLKTSRTQVDRLLDTKNDVTLSSLQRAAAIVDGGSRSNLFRQQQDHWPFGVKILARCGRLRLSSMMNVLAMRDRFHWVRLLSFLTGLVNQELLLRNEYLAAENRILRTPMAGSLRDRLRRGQLLPLWIDRERLPNSLQNKQFRLELAAPCATTAKTDPAARSAGRPRQTRCTTMTLHGTFPARVTSPRDRRCVA